MKTILSLFPALFFCFTGFQLEAQTSTNIHLDVEYYLDPSADTIAAKETFFIARFRSDFSGQNYEQIQVISAKRVFAQLNSGQKVYNYSSQDMGTAFSSGMAISSCFNLNPSYFTIPADKIIPNNPSNFYSQFLLRKNGNASDDWNLTILPDYRFQTRVDTMFVLSKNGKKFIPVTVPQFLDPEKSSLIFVETWNFNPLNGQFRKNVHHVGYMEEFEKNGEHLGYRWTACLDNPDTTGIQTQDVLFKKDVVTDVAMSCSETRLFYDTLTWKYNAVDGIMDIQNPMGNVSEAQRTQLFAALINYAFRHPENVYPVTADLKIDSLHALGKPDKVESLFIGWDSTNYVEDPYDSGKFILAPLVTENVFDNIYGLRFYEDWYYDPKDFVIKKRVKGIGLLMIKPYALGDGANIEDEKIYIKVF